MNAAQKIVSSLVVALALTSPSYAIQIVTGGLITPHYLSSSGDDDYSGVFNLAGFNPLTQQIDSAVASFAFSDGYSSDSALEKVDISLGGNLLIDNQEVNGTHQNSPYTYAWYSASLSGPMITDLGVDGSISYFVQLLDLSNNADNTWLKGAKLTAQVSDKSRRNVADGGATAALLGMAMLGMGWLRRKS